jgi:hypothetical protein
MSDGTTAFETLNLEFVISLELLLDISFQAFQMRDAATIVQGIIIVIFQKITFDTNWTLNICSKFFLPVTDLLLFQFF